MQGKLLRLSQNAVAVDAGRGADVIELLRET